MTSYHFEISHSARDVNPSIFMDFLGGWLEWDL